MTVLQQPLRRPRAELSFFPATPVRLLPTPTANAQSKRRRLWELSPSLHCSIIGTCFNTRDLRRVIGKLSSDAGVEQSDHDLHKIGVSLASDGAVGGKLLHKALDARYETTLKRFNRAKTSDELRDLWQQCRRKGDIPGAYWAILTSPIASEELARDVFGDVHMLSHLVGAANRADIQRLASLEEENAALSEKVVKQQGRLHHAHAAFEREVAHLRLQLAEKPGEAEPAFDEERRGDELDKLRELSSRLEHQLARESARARRLDETRSAARGENEDLRRKLVLAQRQIDERDAALRSLEAFVARSLTPQVELGGLAERRLLYVGGRVHSLPQLELAAIRYGAQLSHHDGGQQESIALLPALVARADLVFFPVDCISHEAALSVKRLCKQLEKPFVPLLAAGLGSFVFALENKLREYA